MTRLCVCLKPKSITQAKAYLEEVNGQADLIEWRLDALANPLSIADDPIERRLSLDFLECIDIDHLFESDLPFRSR